jgi:hypothetical protein
MAIGLVIELVSLPERHPKPGNYLLKRWGAAAVFRLSRDPTEMPKGTTTRGVMVDRLSPVTAGLRLEETRAIGWNGDTGVTEDDLVRLQVTAGNGFSGRP